MVGIAAAPDLGLSRRRAAALAAGSLAACAVLAVADPDRGGPYPACPTRALLGLDCPACGTLRGLHALGRARPLEALDHNLLLLVAVPLGLVAWARWLATALGRPRPAVRLPRWSLPALVTAATAYAVLRNLPVDQLGWLASTAGG